MRDEATHEPEVSVRRDCAPDDPELFHGTSHFRLFSWKTANRVQQNLLRVYAVHQLCVRTYVL